MTRDDVPTPALLLDLDRFERNLERMAGHVRRAGKRLRPHAKTHRCPEIAKRQVAAGGRRAAGAPPRPAAPWGWGPGRPTRWSSWTIRRTSRTSGARPPPRA